MAIPPIVALYQWLRGKPDVSFPILNDYFAQQALDEVVAQSKLNNGIFIRAAQLKAQGQKPEPKDVESAWFANAKDYGGLADFVRFIRGQNEQMHHNAQVTLSYLLMHPETADNPLNAFNTLFLTWLSVYPQEAISWYEDDDIQESLLSIRQEIHFALGRQLTEYYQQEARVLFASVANPIGLIPLFAEYYDNPQRLAAFILCLLEQGITPAKKNEIANKITQSGLFHEFFLTHAGFMDDINNPVKQFYSLLSAFPEAQGLVEKIKNISLMTLGEANTSFAFYSLDGTDHFEGCGLARMSAAPSKEELDHFDNAQYLLTDTGLSYYNKTAGALQAIALDESQLAELGRYFANDKQFARAGKINSLTAQQIKEITTITTHAHLKQLQIIQQLPIVSYAVPQPTTFKLFYSLFGQRFLLNMLQFYSTSTSDNADAKQMLEWQLNNLSSEGVSQQELVQLLHVLARENKEPLLRAVAELLQETTINSLIESGNFAVFYLISFKAGLLEKLNPAQVQRYIASLKPSDNSFDHLILLRTMLLELKRSLGAEDATALLFDKILNVLMSNPNLDDGSLIESLQSVAGTPNCKVLLQQDAALLSEQLNQSIQGVITEDSGLTPDTSQDLNDAWRDLARKLSVLKKISPDLASNFPHDKYAFYVSVVKAVLDHQGDHFDLQATLSNFFPAIEEQELLLHYPEGSVSEHERTLIELLASIDNEGLWVRAIEQLEAPPINRLNWVEQQYHGQTLVELASKRGNNALNHYLLKENKLSQTATSHLLRAAIDAKLWDMVKHLIYLTEDNKPDLESVSEALVAAAQANQLAALLTPAPSALQQQGLFPAERPKIELPVDPAQLLTLLVAHGEEDTIRQLIHLSPPKFLRSLATRTHVTDYSGRTFNETSISAFGYALWAMDSQMILEVIQKPLQKAFNEGYDEAQVIWQDLGQQFQEIQTTGVSYTLNGATIRGEHHFDFQPLINALNTYITQYDEWTKEACENHWCKIVGMLQRLVPAHVAQHYCEEKSFDGKKLFLNTILLRSLRLRNVTSQNNDNVESWFPRNRDHRLGLDFAIDNGWGEGGVGRRAGPFANVWRNSVALTALCKARTKDLEELREALSTPLQKRSLDASYG